MRIRDALGWLDNKNCDQSCKSNQFKKKLLGLVHPRLLDKLAWPAVPKSMTFKPHYHTLINTRKWVQMQGSQAFGQLVNIAGIILPFAQTQVTAH